MRRRRRWWGAGAVVVAVVAGVVAWRFVAGRDHTPFDGRTVVASGSLVVVVPSTWAVLDNPCGQPRHDYVFLATGAVYNCLAQPLHPPDPPLDSVTIGPADATLGGEGHQPPGLTRVRIGGTDLLASRVDCDTSCRRIYLTPDRRTAAIVESPDASRLAGIAAAALRPVPDGYVAVPPLGAVPGLAGARQDLAAAGLDVAPAPDTEPDQIDDDPLRTEPRAGALVRRGATVYVVPAD